MKKLLKKLPAVLCLCLGGCVLFTQRRKIKALITGE